MGDAHEQPRIRGEGGGADLEAGDGGILMRAQAA
jgi:hypothetical protein